MYMYVGYANEEYSMCKVYVIDTANSMYVGEAN